jgi:pyruvate/2-oxoglutarate dehydrogenase complex dihydrolipoamide dehydrogenase (E3) component
MLGLRVVLIERGRMGGECLNTGCVPSKALLAAAAAAHSARTAGRLGIGLPAPAIDWAAIRAHVQAAIARLAPADSVERFTGLGVEVLAGEARFTGRRTLQVLGRSITARRIVIATGSRPAIPDIPGLAETAYLTNETLFDLPTQPAHLLILGGGPAGLEMAQAFARLGSRVTLIDRDRIAAREDAELADLLRAALRAEGVAILEQASVTAVEPGHAPGVAVLLADGRRIAGSHLLVVAGRIPDLASLAPGAGGVAVTAQGIATDAGLRSLSNPAVWAVGDIADPARIGPRRFTHAASAHAALFVRRALFRLPARLNDAILPRAIYTDPGLAQVGLTEAAARAAGHDVRVLRWRLAENDLAQAEDRPAGLVKLVASRRGRLLGAGILAPESGEMISLWTLAVARGLKLSALAGLIVPYPTRAEAGKRAAGTFFTETLFSARTKGLIGLLKRLP